MEAKFKKNGAKCIAICVCMIMLGGLYSHNFIYGTVLLSPIDIDINDSVMNMSLGDFHTHVLKTFEYSKSKDCKYWTKYWSVYLSDNGYNVTYIPVKGHIFLTFQKDGYNYIADQTSLKR